MKQIITLIIFFVVMALFADDLSPVDYDFRTFAIYQSPISHQIIQIEGTDHGWEAWTIVKFEEKLQKSGFIKIRGAESPDEQHLVGLSIARKLVSFGPHPASLNGFGINFKDWETGHVTWYLQSVFLKRIDAIVNELK